MITIGFCDDNQRDQEVLLNICENFFEKCDTEHKYEIFSSGEEVLEYCIEENNDRIDLLFLDIEMDGISGIEAKDRMLRADNIWRIVFVSSYKERVWDSFGLKTLGFTVKPATEEAIYKWIDIVLEEMKEEVWIEIRGVDKKENIRLEEIEYFKAAGNYTEIVLHTTVEEETRQILVTRKLGDLEKELKQYPLVRVHKSYMVNLVNVENVESSIALRDMEEKIPVGKRYKETVRTRYLEYAREKARRRM